MSGRVVLINPGRHFIANEHGIGYLIPLGLVCIGGPLIDAGFAVKLIDHDLYGWSYLRADNASLIQRMLKVPTVHCLPMSV